MLARAASVRTAAPEPPPEAAPTTRALRLVSARLAGIESESCRICTALVPFSIVMVMEKWAGECECAESGAGGVSAHLRAEDVYVCAYFAAFCTCY